jgi:hypothetical protein
MRRDYFRNLLLLGGREIYLNEIGEDAILALFMISCIFGLNRPKFLNTCSLLGKAHVYDRHRP